MKRLVSITSDNPRSENPHAICDAILAGIDGEAARRRSEVEVDRRIAIARTLVEAAPADVVLLAGKGHEDYQEVAGVRHPFSDVVEATQALMQRGAGRTAARSPALPLGDGREAPSGPKGSR